MLVCHSFKFIFVHINRTGGTSVEQALGILADSHIENHTGELSFHLHDTAQNLSKLPWWKNYYKFSVVRNPWDKEVSDYHHHITYEPKGHPKDLTFDQYLELPEQKPDHEDFYYHSNQLDWLKSNGQLELDFIGRFENLQADFSRIVADLNLSGITLPHENKSVRKPYREYYNDKSRELIAKHYQRDIEYFGYSFDE